MKAIELFRSNTFLSLSSQVLNAGLAFVAFALINRISTYTELGKWFLFLSTINLFDLLRTGLVNTPFIKNYTSNTHEEKKYYVGAAWSLMLIISALLSIVIFIAAYFFQHIFNLELRLLPNFLMLFWVLIPINIGYWVLQCEFKFRTLLLLRFLVLILFCSTSIYLYFNNSTTNAFEISTYYLFSNGFAALCCILFNWCSIKNICSWSKSHILALFHFGKYSIGTLLGSTLLRNSDIYLIGYFLGPAAVTIYSIPFKVVEFIEIPVRSFLNASIPTMAGFIQNKNIASFKEELYTKASLLTYLGLPILLGVWMFSTEIVLLFGAQDNIEVSAFLIKVFISFAVLIPFDRYSGVSLDLNNKPSWNMLKVSIMLLINVIGDLCVVQLENGIIGVALISILTFGSGILVGNILLNNLIKIEPLLYLTSGYKKILVLLKK